MTKTHSCHCAKNSVNGYVVSVPKKDEHVCNVPKFSPAQCWQSAKLSITCCQSAKFIMECLWCQKSTDQASMNSCITYEGGLCHITLGTTSEISAAALSAASCDSLCHIGYASAISNPLCHIRQSLSFPKCLQNLGH